MGTIILDAGHGPTDPGKTFTRWQAAGVPFQLGGGGTG